MVVFPLLLAQPAVAPTAAASDSVSTLRLFMPRSVSVTDIYVNT
jgi:hypothetical protein